MTYRVLDIDSSDMKAMLKKLKDMEPSLVREYRKEIKKIAKPVADEIKQNIPNQPPLSGMGFVIQRKSRRDGSLLYSINEGRLNWQGTGQNSIGESKAIGKGPKALQISSAIKPSGKSLTTPIAKVIIMSPAVAMADMAGRGGSGNYGTTSRAYAYRKRNGELGVRRHRVNGQGANLIRKLVQRYGSPSRFGWEALERKIDVVAREIDEVVQKYFDKAYGDR